MYAGKRGSVIAVRGVPGLDRIRICLESNGKNIEIKRTDAVLLSENELLENPYIGVISEKTEIVNQVFFGLKSKENGNNDKYEKAEDKVKNGYERSERSTDEDRKNYRNNNDERRKRNIDDVSHDKNYQSNNYNSDNNDKNNINSENNHYDDEYQRYDKKGRTGNDRIREKDRRNDRENENENDRKRSKDKKREEDKDKEREREREKEIEMTRDREKEREKEKEKDDKLKLKPSWLMTGIRIRIISKKSSSYLLKGSIIDVPSKSVGTIRLDGGKIIEGLKEKYLETVLPPIGGICSVLYGEYKGQNARLIEKRKDEGLAFIQLEDDLQGVLISMDAIASRM